ncbi:hypothetical protein F8S13_05455 [Chloroflexia bacterium SDU3-3]|nr:hypothetical protein F8S13_05455 [Chloroflexia bacterium SDU3-3]
MTDMFTHRVEIFTQSLVIAGSYDLAIYRRMSDAINGEQRRYIPLRDSSIAPLERLSQAQRVPNLLVDRQDTILVATVEEALPPPDYPREEQLRGVVPVAAMFFTEAFVVRGTFHKRPDLTLPEMLERITDDFIPLSHVQVFPLLGGSAPISRDFGALAREKVVALYPIAEPKPAAPVPMPPPPAAEEPAAEEPAAEE